MEILIKLTEEGKRDAILGKYSWDNPREKIPNGMRLAKIEDLEDNMQRPRIGVPFVFQRPNKQIYATRINNYGIDFDLRDAIKDLRVWVKDERIQND